MFNSKDFDDLGHRIAANNMANNPLAWFNIKMSTHPCVVWSVIVINREDGLASGNNWYNRILGMDFYVGFNSNPL